MKIAPIALGIAGLATAAAAALGVSSAGRDALFDDRG